MNVTENLQDTKLPHFLSGRCKCGSSEIQLEINPHGVYRLEIIKYLPLSGDYMVKNVRTFPYGEGGI